jgi:hypothetical protein
MKKLFVTATLLGFLTLLPAQEKFKFGDCPASYLRIL